MCGIVGVIAKTPVASVILEGLKRLEYRGYDSAGIATLVGGQIQRRRATGKISALEARLVAEPLPGVVGIGHTRWATHGKANEANAHPHATAKVAVVHNGIIENYKALREDLRGKGCVFESETDTETIAHLVTLYLEAGLSPQQAAAKTLKQLEGAFAIALIFAQDENMLIAARRGSPLAIGYGEDAMLVGSDALALAPITQRISYLEEGDWAVLTAQSATVYNADDQPVTRTIQQTALSGAMIGKAGYRHFLLKEIFEQPGVIGDTLNSLLDANQTKVTPPPLPFDWQKLSRLTIIGCGAAYYAGMVAKYWFEQIAGLPVEVDIASEYRYRQAPIMANSAMLVISQSGETADTLGAMQVARAAGQKVLAVVNVPSSTMARLADGVIPTLAGPEISVSSSKGFTTQLAALACLALDCAAARGHLTPSQIQQHLTALQEVPAHLTSILQHHAKLQQLGGVLATASDALYLGRGLTYAIALEGALKLKELSYIHAEAYAAGELKHGPIALIDDTMPVVVLAPPDSLFEKTISNVQEVMARGGKVVFFSSAANIASLEPKPFWHFAMPESPAFVAPLLYTVPMQLLSYYTAIAKGTDVDQPRNLAKSVTVE